MPDTVKTQAELITDFANNSPSKAITAQKLRNFVVSVIYHDVSNLTTLPGDLALGGHDISGGGTITATTFTGAATDATARSAAAAAQATADAALPKAGGTMAGNIAMGTHDISGGGTVTAAAFVGDGSALTGVSGSGDFKADGTVPMTGPLDVGSHLIIGATGVQFPFDIFTLTIGTGELTGTRNIIVPDKDGTLLVDSGFTMVASSNINMNAGTITNVDSYDTISIGGGYKFNGIKVVGAQQGPIDDATDGTDVITQLNTLLAACRNHGLILPPA